jgi:uncharacterized Zn-binding protein involved in type VI secretion
MSGSDEISKLKLSDPQDGASTRHLASGAVSIEDKIAEREAVVEYTQRIKELEKTNAELLNLQEKLQQEVVKPAASKSSDGSAGHIAHAQGWKAVCTSPDFCKVGKEIVAFNSFATLDNKQTASPNVKARGTPVYRKGDVIKTVQGNAGEHIVSGTSLSRGHVKILDGHANVKVNGIPVARHDSRCLINCDASGAGGAQGKIVTEQQIAGPTATAPVTNEGARTSERLEALKQVRDQIASGLVNFDASDELIDFQQSNDFLERLICQISGRSGAAGYAAQAVRGALGFGKDLVMGIGELAYEGAKAVPKLGQLVGTKNGRLLAQVDAQILGEEIKLGNLTPATFGQRALALGNAIVKPVTDPWKRGQYVEAGTRAVAELSTLGLSGLDVAKAAKIATRPVAAIARKATSTASTTVPRGVRTVTGGVHVKALPKPEFSGDWNNYKTHGLKADPMGSPEGRRIVAEYEKAGFSRVEAIREARMLIKSGRSLPLPNPIEVGDKFYKVVTEGVDVGKNSAFWATREEINALSGLGYDEIANALGVPLASQQGRVFAVVEITAVRPGTSFTSVIAATTEIGKDGEIWKQAGGKQQTLLLNRGDFTAPRRTDIRFP